VNEWVWVASSVIYALHDAQISEHGGLHGVRDENGLQSALARPRNKAAYEKPDAPELAAAYLWGLVRNHPFLDGNKRTGWVVARTFLILNGHDVQYTQAELVGMVRAVAANSIDESAVATWFRQRLVPPR
jgi:death-on-curing protein